jgi:uroporphyrinogen-III decarboxylase
MFVRPDNWSELSPLERRKLRLDHWQNQPVEFESPEAEAAYKERITRIRQAFDIEPSDRFIADLGMAAYEYGLRRSGITGTDILYHPEKLADPMIDFNLEFDPDMASGAFAYPGPAMDLLGFATYRWAGNGGLPESQTIQMVEGEYMTADEYREFADDPSGFFIHKYLPRMFSELGGLSMLPTFPLLTESLDVTNLAFPFAMPPVRDAVKKLLEAGEIVEKFMGATMHVLPTVAAKGYPAAPAGGFCKAPFDFLGDTLRGTKGIMMDMYRNPDDLLAACEAYVPVLTRSLIQSADMMGMPLVMFPLHKGADGFMSDAQFKKFYWPTFKAVMMAFYEEGLTNSLFVEGCYDSRLEIIEEMPEKSCYWFFDQSDMKKVKETLGGKFTIGGNVPASMMATGTTEEVERYCADLVELMDGTPGYIMTFGCGFENSTDDKLRAYRDSVRK